MTTDPHEPSRAASAASSDYPAAPKAPTPPVRDRLRRTRFGLRHLVLVVTATAAVVLGGQLLVMLVLGLVPGIVSFYDDQGTMTAPTYTPTARELLAAAEIELPPSASEPVLTVPNVSPTRFKYAYRVEFTLAEEDVAGFVETLPMGDDQCSGTERPCDLPIQEFSALGVARHQPPGSLYRRGRIGTTGWAAHADVLMVGPDRTKVYVAVST